MWNSDLFSKRKLKCAVHTWDGYDFGPILQFRVISTRMVGATLLYHKNTHLPSGLDFCKLAGVLKILACFTHLTAPSEQT